MPDAAGTPASPPFQVRPLVVADLADLFQVQEQSFAPEFREPEAALRNRMALFPAGALGCFEAGRMAGYVFALPWRAGLVIDVGEVVRALPDQPDVIWIHDMVVAPACRQRGVASILLASIVELADRLHLDRFSLVAVQGSEAFWERSGFAALARIEYVPGASATRMEGSLDAIRRHLANVPNSRKQTE